jgi:hypothetical protein
LAGLRASASVALIVGTLLASFETLVNWGQWQWWPFWLVDFVGAALLIGGGVLTLRNHVSGDRILCAGWAFNIGMAWMSMAGNIEMGTDPARAGRVAGFYVALIGLHIAVSTLCLLLAITARRQS